MLGFEDVGAADLTRWSHSMIAGMANFSDDPAVWERLDTAQGERTEVLDELVPFYRERPNASLTSAWANSGPPLDAVHTNVKLTISGGLNEPQHMVSTMVWALSDRPAQRELLAAEPERWRDAFDEAIRLVSPIGAYTRETTRPTTLEGVDLPAGATVSVTVAAANHDPGVFQRADEFDVTRPRVSHLGFGSGVHLCAGHWAARIAIGETAVPLLYRELPGLRTDTTRPLEWYGWVFRGLTTLPVTWDAA